MKKWSLLLILLFISYLSHSQLFKYVYDKDEPNYFLVEGFTGTLHLANSDTVFGYIEYHNDKKYVTVQVNEDDTVKVKTFHFSKIAHFYISTDSHIVNHNYILPIKYRDEVNCYRIIDNRTLPIVRLEYFEQINFTSEVADGKVYIVHRYFVYDKEKNKLIPIDSFRKDLYPYLKKKKGIIDAYIFKEGIKTTDTKITGRNLLKVIHFYNSLK